MRDLFKSYYPLTDAELQVLWDKALIGVDANVLLNLYRYPDGASQDILKVLRTLRQRLWLPHQCALEFQRRRTGVRFEQVNRFGQVLAALQRAEASLKEDLDKLDLKKRHAKIDPDAIVAEIHDAIDKSTSRLSDLRKIQELALESDPIHDEIADLFEGNIGKPFLPDALDQLYKEGAVRYQHSRPPGYLDNKKSSDPDGAYYFEELLIRGQFGDLIAWKQLLVEAAERKTSDVIYVTDDDKEDWWLRQGGRTIGPRRELIDEMRLGGVERFHLYNSERFIQYASAHRHVKIQPQSVEQIKRAKATSGKSAPRFTPRVQAMAGWIHEHWNGHKFSKKDGTSIDYLLTSAGERLGLILTVKASDEALAALPWRLEVAQTLDLDKIYILLASRSPLRLGQLLVSDTVRELNREATVMFLQLHSDRKGKYEVSLERTFRHRPDPEPLSPA